MDKKNIIIIIMSVIIVGLVGYIILNNRITPEEKDLKYADTAAQVGLSKETLKSMCNSSEFYAQHKDLYKTTFHTDADRNDVCSLDQGRIDAYLSKRNEEYKLYKDIEEEIVNYYNDVIKEYSTKELVDGKIEVTGDTKNATIKFLNREKDKAEIKIRDGVFQQGLVQRIEEEKANINSKQFTFVKTSTGGNIIDQDNQNSFLSVFVLKLKTVVDNLVEDNAKAETIETPTAQ